MDIRHLSRVEKTFHEAIGLNDQARSRYLADFPPNDRWLVDEVESLLNAYFSTPKFLDQSVFEIGLSVLEESPESTLTGKTVGPYKILNLLGKGGMGDVYLSEDLRLNRKVALKFLSRAFLEDNWAKRQLVREARAVAMLDHRNICPVYGYEEIDDYRFIVMQYVEGVSLAQLLSDNNVDVQNRPQIALEIVEAIAEAHAHGIIHRDIKPGNVMISSDGNVKVLDFGLAKFIHANDNNEGKNPNDTQLSRPGLIPGTIAYMSPEQLKAEKLDYRSDIFSIGILLFELMSGLHPFQKDSDAETISSIIDKNCSFDPGVFSKVAVRFRYPIRKCLEKQKEKRYQSASELALDLQISRPRPMTYLSQYYWRALIGFLLILVAVASYFFLFRVQKPYSMIVLRYKNETGDSGLEYLGDGIADSLSTKLGMSGKIKLRIVPTEVQYSDPSPDPLTLGRENGVEYILSGKITQQSDQLMLRTDVLDVADGVAVRSWNIPFRVAELSELEEKVAEQLYTSLKLPDGSGSPNALKRNGATTENSEALRQYYLGRYLWKKRDRENIKLAITAFERAIAIDPGYSRAYSGLSDCYVLLNLVAYGTVPTAEAMTKAKAAARQALEIDPYDSGAHTSLGVVLTRYDWNWAEAEREFRLAIQIDSDYPAAHYWYSGLLAVLGRVDEAISEAKKAKELDPFFPSGDMNLARIYYYARQYDKALEVLNNPLPTAPLDKKSRYLIGLVYIQKGMFSDARQIFEDISSENRLFGAAALGYTYAKLGRRDEALKIISELQKGSKENYVPPHETAIVYIGLQDKDKAISSLNEAFKERHAALISIMVEPLFDSLRNDRKFLDLQRSMALK